MGSDKGLFHELGGHRMRDLNTRFSVHGNFFSICTTGTVIPVTAFCQVSENLFFTTAIK